MFLAGSTAFNIAFQPLPCPCYLCPNFPTLPNYEALAVHLAEAHPLCPGCHARYRTVEAFQEHRCPKLAKPAGTHNGARADVFQPTTTPTIPISRLENKKKKQEKKKANVMFACGDCFNGSKYATREKLEKHQRKTCHGPYMPNWSCYHPQCQSSGQGEKFKSFFALTYHERTCHATPQKEGYTCKDCLSIFKDSAALLLHEALKTHGCYKLYNPSNGPIECPISKTCGQSPSINGTAQLRSHLSSTHLEAIGRLNSSSLGKLDYCETKPEEDFKCFLNHCTQRFSFTLPGTTSYKIHLKSEHKIEPGKADVPKQHIPCPVKECVAMFKSISGEKWTSHQHLHENRRGKVAVQQSTPLIPTASRLVSPMASSSTAAAAAATVNPSIPRVNPVQTLSAQHTQENPPLTSASPGMMTCKVGRCGKQFTNVIDFHNHELKTHPNSRTQWTAERYKLSCPHCSKLYWDNTPLSKHIMKKHFKTGKPRTVSESWQCLSCALEFPSTKALQEHTCGARTVRTNDPSTTVPKAVKCPNECPTCKKQFKNVHALRSHMKSKVHKSKAHKSITPNLTCIRPGCGRKFGSPSAMLHHIEAGTCSKDLDRHVVNQLIIQNDPTGIITDHCAIKGLEAGSSSERKSIVDSYLLSNQQVANDAGSNPHSWSAGDYEDFSDGGVPIFTPTSFTSAGGSVAESGNSTAMDGELTPISYSTGGLSSSSRGMLTPVSPSLSGSNLISLNTSTELILLSAKQSGKSRVTCPHCKTSRTFNLSGLESHLKSAAHAPKIFHCPVSILGLGPAEHMRSFTTLSGLVQHVESEACKGGKGAFEKVVKFVEGKLREMGFEATAGWGGRLAGAARVSGMITE